MEQYYIATAEGQTEGPYAFGTLKTLYTHNKITEDALVCIAGGQEWVTFRTVLEHKWKKANQQTGAVKKTSSCNPLIEQKEDYNSIPKDRSTKKNYAEPEPLTITVEGLFYVVGVIALIAAIVLLVYNLEEKHPEMGFVYLVFGVFSCLGCFWCAKVIKLLSRAVDFLSMLAEKTYRIKGKD